MTFALPQRRTTPHPGAELPAVEARGLGKEFRRRARGSGRLARRQRVPALRDVTFTIARGECVAILGQNGSGKSTLVRLLSTLLLHDAGEAHIFGHDAFASTRAVRRLVNRVSVEASFFKRMSAEENLSYAARFYGLTHGDTRRLIPEILGRVGFPAERRGEPMENLSRGMQQKVALARALLDRADAAAARRADDGARPPLQARGAVVHRRDPRRARRDDPALHARPGRGRGPGRPRRHPRPRRVARARARRRAARSLRRRRRSSRRSSPRPGASSRTRTTTSGRCSPDAALDPRDRSPRADRPRRRRRAQLVPRQALRLVGARVLRLDGREHAHDRLHRRGRRGVGRLGGRQPADGGAADRRRRLGLPRDHLRDPHRDGRLGALGGDDRIHLHGAAVAPEPPRRHGRVRDRLRVDPGDAAVRLGRADRQPLAAGRELRGRVRAARGGVGRRSSASG